MVKALRKVTNYLGLTEDDLTTEVATTEAPVARRLPSRASATTATPTPISPARLSVAQSAPIESNVMPTLDRIVTLHPRFYSEARTIGEHFRSGSPVIMNLSDMEESERKRLVDFASGLVFGHAGTIERVTPKVFLLSPPNVMVSTEMKAAAADASFFNQS